ncbi:MAG: deoxyribose-phosphate aldolase [Flavobacteriaceae bacterium]|nr:deoxyribose-phosphate aldolase [Flavobacteriaceae bacterium]
MDIKSFLDSTYLKTAEQAGISELENNKLIVNFIQEAIDEKFKLVMVRPEVVTLAKKMIVDQNSKVTIGTVIDFPKGNSSYTKKINQAKKAILDGADDLDFVCNYEAFKKGNIPLIKKEILKCTQFVIQNNKTIKWIIEVAALNNQQIIQLSTLIKNVVISNFKEDVYPNVFVKSSTGFYKTKDNLPNGATVPSIIMMLENASPLPIKASGGVRNREEVMYLIRLGVKRIGTSSAKLISRGESEIVSY